MALPKKPPMARRRRIALAIAVGVLAHVLMLPFVAKDAIFNVPPQRRRAQVGLVSQRTNASPSRSTPDSVPSPGRNDPLAPRLPKDEQAELKKQELQKVPGQVVSLGQPQDERPPDKPTRYLSEKDSRVLKETRARETSAFFKNALSKAQKEGKDEQQKAPAPRPPAEPPPGQPEPGKQGEKSAAAAAAQPAPARERQDGMQLKTAPDGTVRNRPARDRVPGADRRVAMARPRDEAQRAATPSPRQGAGANNRGVPGGKGKPLQLALDRPLDVLGPVAGGPAPDDLRGAIEGDETLLNSRSFRYAGFLNRVKETVGRIWVQQVQDETSRRDPTGQTYLYKDRRTVVEFTLDAKGDIKDVRVAATSGVPYLDQVAADAFRKAERFPNPPSGLVGPEGRFTSTFAFTLLSDSGGGRIRLGPAYVPGSPAHRGW
jgi:TonB family protein